MSCCQTAAATTVEHANGGGLRRRVEEDRLLAVSHEAGNGTMQTDFTVPSMHCAACITKIERGLSNLDFVERARANLSLKRVSVTWRKDRGSVLEIDKALSELGFEHFLFDPDLAAESNDRTGRQLLLAMAVAGFAAANIMLLSVSVWSGADTETRDLFHLISGVIAAPAIYFAGQPFFLSALKALRARGLNMDVPISLAVILAFSMSVFEALRGGGEVYFDASVTLLFFLLVGRYLDHMMRDRARNAVVRLAKVGAKGGVRVEEDGELHYIALNAIEPGMVLRVAPGETVPVDGRILIGTSELDRSLVTGESAPAVLGPGCELEAGTANLTGTIDILVTQRAENSFLASVMRMMAAAENGRGAYVRIADRMARIYAPAVHLLALCAFIGWMAYTSGDWHTSIFVAISVLIVTCPCALGLAVPVVHVIGAGKLFEAGILVKDGSAIERLAEADRVVFDKTGTLTTGKPSIRSAPFKSDFERQVARALAMRSIHPASIALRDLPGKGDIELAKLHEVPGHGIEAMVGKRRARLGRADWAGEIAAHANDRQKDRSDRFPLVAEGAAFCLEGNEPVSILLEEKLRSGAVETVTWLEKHGMDTEILSGDSKNAVEKIAAIAGIKSVRYGQLPAAKIERLKELQSRGNHVLMVGDGLNDAPALMASHVSMAPASGSDAGRLAADFVFTREDLGAVPYAIEISRHAASLVRQNFALAILYNCIAVPLAVAGQVTPLWAALAMSASSIVVVANSMRLNWTGTTPTNPGIHHAPITSNWRPAETETA
jgi:P-type Cu2+ transporter